MTSVTDHRADRIQGQLEPMEPAMMALAGCMHFDEGFAMASRFKTLLLGLDQGRTVLFDDVALPIMLGGLLGLGTGGLVWMMAVVQFGLMRWVWP